MSYKTTDEFLKMFGYTSLKDLPELPRYKLDSNQQIVIDDLVENEKNKNDKDDEHIEDITSQEEINKPHSKQEAPMPEREGVSDFQK